MTIILRFPTLAMAGLVLSMITTLGADPNRVETGLVESKSGEPPGRFPCPEASVARYTAFRVTEPILIDGKLEEAAWKAAPQSPRFVDILSGQRAIHGTRAAVVWDDEYMYV